MVVLHHDELHRTLWGAASTAGRSKATDAAVYVQLILLLLAFGTCAVAYDKPTAVRLAVATVTTLLYFRNTALFVRLTLFVSCVVAYGDIARPIMALIHAEEADAVTTVRLGLHFLWISINIRILYALFASGALRARTTKAPRSFVRRKFAKTE